MHLLLATNMCMYTRNNSVWRASIPVHACLPRRAAVADRLTENKAEGGQSVQVELERDD